jgi:hypothetical protein
VRGQSSWLVPVAVVVSGSALALLQGCDAETATGVQGRGSVDVPGAVVLSDEALVRAVSEHLGFGSDVGVEGGLYAQAELNDLAQRWGGDHAASFEWDGWVIKKVEGSVNLEVGDVIRFKAIGGGIGSGAKTVTAEWGVFIVAHPPERKHGAAEGR